MLSAATAVVPDCRAVARTGDLPGAWAALLAATGTADPVLGPRGHGLRPAGAGWDLLRAAGADNRPPGWVAALGRLRLGLSEWLLDQAIAHLRDRATGGAPLIQQQLVRGNLADAVIIQQEVLGMLAADVPGAYPHGRLTEADRITLRLLGASGFLSDGPGQLAYLSELLADAYLEPS
jgi:alkylation response protein AidB-like acyl-CoA dehydrogenase